MAEPSMQVPVALLETLRREYADMFPPGVSWSTLEALTARLSQEVSNAEEARVEYGVVLDDLGSTDTYATEAEARAAATADTPVVRIVTTPLDAEQVACLHWEPGQVTMRDACTACDAEADPPSSVELVPGSTFVAPQRWIVTEPGPFSGRAQAERAGSVMRYLDEFDPSTIRDVTPPPSTAAVPASE